jgi:hypothetical protein
MVSCGIGFSEGWQGVQRARKRPTAGNSRQRPDAPLAHLSLAIPCRVAPPQSPTPLHQTKPLYEQWGQRALWKRKDEDRVEKERRLHRPFLREEALADACARPCVQTNRQEALDTEGSFRDVGIPPVIPMPSMAFSSTIDLENR